MNDIAVLDPAKVEIPSPVTNYVEVNPTSVLLDEKLWERFLGEIKQEIAAHVPDLKTDKGRKAIAALAAKVSRTKTAIDAAGLELTAEWRERTKTVNAARSVVTMQLDELRDLARKPLTDWEEAEKARYRRCDATIAFLEGAVIVSIGDTVESLTERHHKVLQTDVTMGEFKELFDRASAAWTKADQALIAGIDRLTREAAEKAELERLRAEAAERARLEQERLDREREAAAAAELKRRQEEEAAAAEQRRQQELAEAAERARLEAEERAQAEAAAEARRREAAEHEAAEALAAAQRQAEEARAAAERAEADRKAAVAKAEQDAIEAARRAREEAEAAIIARQKQEAEETARRAADRENRSAIMTAAKLAFIVRAGVDEDTARRIVLSITAGNIPHVVMTF